MAKARLLAINLTRKSYEYRDVTLELLGGRGGAGEYYHSISDKNAIVIAFSRFSQSPNKAGGRYSIGYNAPLDGEFRCSTVRGRFGGVTQGLGLDLIGVQGALEERGTVIIGSDKVQFLKNIDTAEKDMPFIKIGQSGRNLSKVATVCDETGRQFGRGGLGAAFGGKGLEKLGVIPHGEPSTLALPQGISCENCEKEAFCENIKAESVADKFFIDSSIFKALAKHLGVIEAKELKSLGAQLSQQNGIYSDYLKSSATAVDTLKKDSDVMMLADCLGLCGVALAGHNLKPEEKGLVSRVRLIEQGL